MKYRWTIALPFLLSLAAALVQATIVWLGGLHPGTPAALIVVTLALAGGDFLRAQLAIAQAKRGDPE